MKTEGKSYCYQRNEFSTLWDSTYTCTCTLLYTSVAIMKRSSYSICKEAVSSGSVLAKQRLSSLCKYLQIAFLSFSCCRPQKEKKSLLAGWLLPSLWLSVYVGCQSFKVFQLIIINIIITGHHMDSVCHLGNEQVSRI